MLAGVQSVAIEGRERNHLVVVGEGLDAVSLTSYLRKKVGGAQIVQVDQVVGGGAAAAEKTMPPKTATAASSVLAAGSQQWQPRYYYSGYYSRSRTAPVHPYAAGQYDHDHDHDHNETPRYDADSSCAIM